MSRSFDNEGFIENLSDWTPEVAVQIAASEGLVLAESHWEILNTLRDYFAETDTSPSMRPFVKMLKKRLGEEKGNSLYLLKLFGQNRSQSSAAKIAAKIAGLPRPTNCD